MIFNKRTSYRLLANKNKNTEYLKNEGVRIIWAANLNFYFLIYDCKFEHHIS